MGEAPARRATAHPPARRRSTPRPIARLAAHIVSLGPIGPTPTFPDRDKELDGAGQRFWKGRALGHLRGHTPVVRRERPISAGGGKRRVDARALAFTHSPTVAKGTRSSRRRRWRDPAKAIPDRRARGRASLVGAESSAIKILRLLRNSTRYARYAIRKGIG